MTTGAFSETSSPVFQTTRLCITEESRDVGGMELYLHSFLTSNLDVGERSALHPGCFEPRTAVLSLGRDSSVGIATPYRLEGSGIESGESEVFSAFVQTGSGAHPVSCKIGTGSFPVVKLSGRSTDLPPPSSADVKERVELYFYFSSGLHALFQGELDFTVVPTSPINRLFGHVLSVTQGHT